MAGCGCAVGLLFAGLLHAAPATGQDAPGIQQMLEQTRADMQRLNRYAEQAASHIAALEQRLVEAEQRNQAQAARIEALDSQLRLARAGQASPWPARVFAAVEPGPVVEAGPDFLRIPTDDVFVFGTGELGAEGRDRLRPVARSLVASLAQLPPDLEWRLEVGGHTDRRPLRNSARFPDNWALSAARAVAVLDFLHEQGVASPRLVAAAYGASAPLDTDMSKAAHRRNRRVELRLRIDTVDRPRN